MFGWFKKRMLARMARLTKVAQLATFAAVRKELEHDESGAETLSDALDMKAAAATNFLFGNSPTEMHAKHLDLAVEHAAALDWLRVRPFYRELVVQTLRVIRTVQFGRDKSRSSTIGEGILLEFGPQFPDAPMPETYDALVLRAVQALPEEDQNAIAQWRTR